MAIDGRIIPAGICRPKVAEARSITSSAESRRRRIGPAALPWLHRLRKSSVLGEHSWKRFATSSEDWGLCGVRWWSDREGRGKDTS